MKGTIAPSDTSCSATVAAPRGLASRRANDSDTSSPCRHESQQVVWFRWVEPVGVGLVGLNGRALLCELGRGVDQADCSLLGRGLSQFKQQTNNPECAQHINKDGAPGKAT
jgi:hypothetical protein